MRPEHTPEGDPCERCGAAAASHRHRVRKRPAGRDHREHREREYVPRPRKPGGRKRSGKRVKVPPYFVMIDGEGRGRRPHRYVLLAWSDESGERSDYIENENGLSTVDCLEFLLRIPPRARAYSFAFCGYDLTMMLADMPDRLLYELFHQEKRARAGERSHWGPLPVKWSPDPDNDREGYSLNLQGTKFSVRRLRKRGQPKPRSRVVWDIFKFYGCRFTMALERWQILDVARRKYMQEMKDKRGKFDKETMTSVREYCFSECSAGAELANKLVDAHEKAGLHLTKFYGPGSTATLILSELGIGKRQREVPEHLRDAVMRAYAGGWFEHSVLGPVAGPVYGWDISSAYPYQLWRLPCLDHGQWVRTRSLRRIERAAQALVRYRLGRAPKNLAWGPFTFRFSAESARGPCDSMGGTCHPAESGGGWVWRDEFVAAARIFPHVDVIEAWVLEQDCHCQPFRRIANYYLERLRWGKDGPGLSLKGGVNSCYGKLVQSVGDPPFQSFAWGGMVTSGTRAQQLEAIGLHDNAWNMLGIATDGFFTRERLTLPKPLDTGTLDEHDKPLGGWEAKGQKQPDGTRSYAAGMFFLRPGLYFPLGAELDEEERESVRGRGVGREVMLRASKKVVKSWERGESIARFPRVQRFWGAKSSITMLDRPGGALYRRNSRFGEWTSRPVEVELDPQPKRDRVLADGVRLRCRRISEKFGESARYVPKHKSREALLLAMATVEALEQPDPGEGDNFALNE